MENRHPGNYLHISNSLTYASLLTGLLAALAAVKFSSWNVSGALIAFCALLPGIVPIGNFPSPDVAMAMSSVGTLILLGTNGWMVIRGARLSVPTVERTPAHVDAEPDGQSA